MDLGERAGRSKFLIGDRDGRFTAAFDGVFAGNGTRVIKTPVRRRWANSFAQRFVWTLRRECLDHVLILGELHLRKMGEGQFEGQNGARRRWFRLVSASLRQRITWSVTAPGLLEPLGGTW